MALFTYKGLVNAARRQHARSGILNAPTGETPMKSRERCSRTRHRTVVMMGTSPEAKGGIATVVSNYRDLGLLKRWRVRYIVTHVQRSRLIKACVAISALLELLAMLAGFRVALVHVHITSGPSTWRKLIYLYTAMLFRVPTCIHVHSGDYFEFYQNRCSPIQKGIIRFAFRKADSVIVLSESWLDGIRGISAQARCTVVYNAVVPDETVRADLADECGLNGKPMLLYLGQISAVKGVFDLLRACAELKREFRLVVAGDGDLETARSMAKDLGIESKVDFPGWVRGRQKAELLRQAQLLVLPSYTEGIPMAILEGMSSGLPIIATPVGGIPETIDDGCEGIMIPVGDTGELCSAIERLLCDPDLCHRLGDAGRRRIERDYSPAAVYPGLEAVWAEAGVHPVEERFDGQASTFKGGWKSVSETIDLNLDRRR